MTARTEIITKAYENKLRRMAMRQGFTLLKSKVRDPQAIAYGGWTIVNAETGMIEAGHNGFLNMHEVAAFLRSEKPDKRPLFKDLSDLRVIPIGHNRIIACDEDEAYIYRLWEDAGDGNTVMEYAVNLLLGGEWSDTAEEWLINNNEVWETYLKRKAEYERLESAYQQVQEDVREGKPGVDQSYSWDLFERFEKAWCALSEAREPIKKAIDAATDRSIKRVLDKRTEQKDDAA